MTAAPKPDPDYAEIIDAEIWAFIRACESHYPPDAATMPIAAQRAVYDALCRAFDPGRPESVSTTDRPFGGVSCRLYEPEAAAGPVVVYLHGGGWVVGGLASHDAICAEIAAATGFPLVAVDYRLAPEHRHPAQFDDALAAIRAIADVFGRPLILCGDSAGGTLAASLAHHLRGDRVAVLGQVLIYPALDRLMSGNSYYHHRDAPLLARTDMEFYLAERLGPGTPAERDVTAWPLDDDTYHGLPPTIVFAAECDPLADDGALYADRIRAAGGQARFVVEAGLVHGYLRARMSSARAAAAFGRITAAIAELGRKA